MPASTDLDAAADNSKVVKRPGSNAILVTPSAGPVVLPDGDAANLLPDDFEIIKVGEAELTTKFKLDDSTFFETTATATTVAEVVSDLTAWDTAFGVIASEA